MISVTPSQIWVEGVVYRAIAYRRFREDKDCVLQGEPFNGLGLPKSRNHDVVPYSK